MEDLKVYDNITKKVVPLDELPIDVQNSILKRWVTESKPVLESEIEQLESKVERLKRLNAALKHRYKRYKERLEIEVNKNECRYSYPGERPVNLARIYEAYLESLDEL